MGAEKRLDYLRNQFPKIDNETFEQIVEADPTQEKKYANWLLRLYSKSKLTLTDLPTLTDIIKVHSELKDNIDKDLRDINRFDSPFAFLYEMNKWLVQRFTENENVVKYIRNGAELIFENDKITIVKLISLQGSINYGSNTEWCTLRADHFNSYITKGGLYVFTPKDSTYERHLSKKAQFSFVANEFRNNKNNGLDIIKVICDIPELYKIIKNIDEAKKSSSLSYFLRLQDGNRSEMTALIKEYGFKILSFVEVFSKNLIANLFQEYKENVFEHIPDSEEKLMCYVSAVEGGFKKLVVGCKYELSDKVIEQAIKSYPENILISDTENEELWEYAIQEENWLVTKSPLLKNPARLTDLILESISILSYIKTPLKIFSVEQRQEIAKALVSDSCDNYLEYLKKLGEFDEKFQIQLVKILPECFDYLLKPTEKTKKTYEKILKDREEKRKKELERLAKIAREAEEKEWERKKRSYEDDPWGKSFYKERDDDGFFYELFDKYNKTGKWDGQKLVKMVSHDGHKYYQDERGRVYRTLEEMHREMENRKKYYDNDYSF